MDDQAFTPRTLAGLLRQSDRIAHPSIKDPSSAKTVLKAAARLARQEPVLLGGKMSTSLVRGKRVNVVTDLSLELVLRKLNSNLRLALRLRDRSRDTLVRTLCEALRDSCAYVLFRLDIKSFYESVDSGRVREKLTLNQVLSPTSVRLLDNIVRWHHSSGGVGLPRGVSVSATLADLHMSGFEQKISRLKEVSYAWRFADDIVIICDSNTAPATALNKIKTALPNELKLNSSKTKHSPISKLTEKARDKDGKTAAIVEYLGYEITVRNPTAAEEGRQIEVDIAKKKVNRTKTRITLSLLDFTKNGDFALLENRIKLITSNYTILDKNGKFKRPAGIYYSYPLVTKLDKGSLDSLDKFMRCALLSGQGPIFSKVKATITQRQTRRLLKMTFRSGFCDRREFDFSPSLISKIQECWKYA